MAAKGKGKAVVTVVKELTAYGKAAIELTQVLKLNPPIPGDTDDDGIKHEIRGLKDDHLIKVSDTFTSETEAVLLELGVRAAAVPAVPVVRGAGKKAPKVLKAPKAPKAEKKRLLGRPDSVLQTIRVLGKGKTGTTAAEVETFSTAEMTKTNGKSAGRADQICIHMLAALVAFGVMSTNAEGRCHFVSK